MLPNLSLKVRSAARPVLVVPFALLLLGIAFAILAPRYSPAAASGYALARVSLEARRTGAISAETSRGLDRQLASVVPEVRELRPRFAPAIR